MHAILHKIKRITQRRTQRKIAPSNPRREHRQSHLGKLAHRGISRLPGTMPVGFAADAEKFRARRNQGKQMRAQSLIYL